MEHKIFAIYDQKAFAYLPPFTLPRVEMAMRTFGDCVNSADHSFGKHPEDFTLMEIGIYDDSNAKINPHELAITVGSGLEFVKKFDTTQGIPDGPTLGDVSSIQPSSERGNSA